MNTPDTNKNTDSLDNSLVNNNTPDTEWEERLFKEIGGDYCNGRCELFHCHKIKLFIRNLLSSRDTYWKERVRKEVEDERERQYDLIMDCLPRDAENLSTLTPYQAKELVDCFIEKHPWSENTPITNEDNLK